MFLYKQKDIILIPFPFSDGSSQKKRPVLVVSCDSINRHSETPDFIGIMVTASAKRGKYHLDLCPSDLTDGSLPEQSSIRCDKIASILKDKAVKKLATVTDSFFKAILAKIDEVLGK